MKLRFELVFEAELLVLAVQECDLSFLEVDLLVFLLYNFKVR